MGSSSVEGGIKAKMEDKALHASSSSSTEGTRQDQEIGSNDEDENTTEQDLLEIGSFGAPHGVKGNIRLFPSTDSADERLTQAGIRYVHDYTNAVPALDAGKLWWTPWVSRSPPDAARLYKYNMLDICVAGTFSLCT